MDADWPMALTFLIIATALVAAAIFWAGARISNAVSSLKVGASPEEVEAITQRVMGTANRLRGVRSDVEQSTGKARGIEPDPPRGKGGR